MRPGDRVASRFLLERLAGSGAMGSVYRAVDGLTGGPVALKALHRQGFVEARFEREAEVLAGLEHPGIVRYVAHGRSGDGEGDGAGDAWLAIEWLDGIDLAERLVRGPLGVAASVGLVRRVAEALGAAHARGVLHRDVKPSNLFLVGGSTEHVKVLDFGVARLGGLSGGTRTGALLGTPGYMAPEQARGERGLGPGADVFALGCVFFECLTGTAAFAGTHPMAVLAKVLFEEAPRLRELLPEAPAALDDLLARMLSKSPGGRPVDGVAVAAELWALGELEVTRAPTGPGSTRRLGGVEKRLVSVVLAGALGEAPTPGEAFADTLQGDEMLAAPALLATRERIQRELGGFAARIEGLLDGSMVATLSSSGSAADEAAQAARFALALRARMPETPMAIGTGRGWIHAERWPVGEAIDRAASLLRPGLDPTPIRLDEVTAGLLDARFEVGGDAGGLVLLGEREITEGTRTLLGRPTPCVGREREIAVLLGLFDECVEEPRARAVLVSAAAGVGKSRLRHELTRALAQRGDRVELWIGRGDPMSAGAPFAMIAPAIRRAAGIYDGEPLGVRRQKLRARVGRALAGPSVQRVAEFLGELTGVPFPEDESVELMAARHDAMLMGDQMRRAWEDLLAAECAEAPLVLVLEDLHWGDLPSIQFIDAALSALSDRPLLVLALARPEVRDLFPTLWDDRDVHELRLADLGKRAGEKLARAVLGDAATAATVERVVTQAAGNAFYLEELLRAVAAGKGDALPQTVLAMVEARLERVDPEARRVLRAASVFGEAFQRDGIAALLGGPTQAEGLDEVLDHLVEIELVQRRAAERDHGRAEYTFRFSMVREAAYWMLTDEDRALGHRLAAEWLAGAGMGEPVVLAEHLERGGDRPAAVGWYQRAAAQALEASDLGATLALAERGIRCGAEGEALGRLHLIEAEAYRWRADATGGARAAREALVHLPRGGGAFWAAVAELSAMQGLLGETAELTALVEGLLAEPRHEDELPSDVAVLYRTVVELIHAGRYPLAGRLLERIGGVKSILGGGDGRALSPAAVAQISQARAAWATCRGDVGGGRRETERSIEAAELAGNLRLACLQRANLSDAHLQLGAFVEAERTARDALATAARMGLGAVALVSRINLGIALGRQGRLAEARDALSEALLPAIERDHKRAFIAAAVALADACTGGGALDEAERWARAAAEASVTNAPMHALAQATLARVLLVRGRAPEALQAATAARAALDALGRIAWGEAAVRLVWAEALEAAGQAERARTAIGEARDALTARAAALEDPGIRQSFLERVPENAETMARAREWLP